MNENIQLSPNQLVQFLDKPKSDFTKADLIKFIEAKGIKMINFRYVAGDGRLKLLNFVINNKKYLDSILSAGERVDGSSLFNHIEAGSSDLYVIPRFRTAFVNPFSEIPTLDVLCSFYNKDGEPLTGAPENLVKSASRVLKERTGYDFEVMGELEYYVISNSEADYRAVDQKGYHEAAPFSKFGDFRSEAMYAIAQCGGDIKYGHSEVGNFTLGDTLYEQNEIEFLPVDVEDAADQLVVAKWVLRTMAWQYGYNLTFAPKITTGKAGSGLHIHTRLRKNGKNVMLDDNGKISDVAKRAIAGYLDLAPSLTAFGNCNPTSYFRLVPHQEAPTKICWGDRNRSVLVRVPLGWVSNKSMTSDANPLEPAFSHSFSDKQTVEFRCPDGSADIYALIAGLTVAARHGLEMPGALELAEKTYANVNIFSDEFKDRIDFLKELPSSCVASAEQLRLQAEYYTKFNIFPQRMIDSTIAQLKAFNDDNLLNNLKGHDDKLLEIVNKYFYCG
ncbi:MAG: glutamine synthetase family protein [Bacteroidales bacterium]|nr:glutamine synthetase family protein [Bacteroidales bacterium]